MKNRKFKWNYVFFLALATFMAVSFAVGVSAVECGATPTDGCTVSASTTFSTGIYNLNDTTGDNNGAIRSGADNIVLDCNNATIYGNYSQGSGSENRGITITHNNFTVKNCNVNDYYFALRTQGTGTNFINVSSNYSLQNLIIAGYNTTVINSLFQESQDNLIRGDNVEGLWINNSIFYNDGGSDSMIHLFNVSNVKVYHSLFNLSATGAGILDARSPHDILISNSSFYDIASHCTEHSKNATNIIVENSICVNSGDKGFNVFGNVTNILFRNNVVTNPTVSGITFNTFDGITYGYNFTSLNNSVIGGATGVSFRGISMLSSNDIISNSTEGITGDGAKDVLYSNTIISNVNRCFRSANLANNLTISNMTCNSFNTTLQIQNSSNINIQNSFNDLTSSYFDFNSITYNVTFTNILGYNLTMGNVSNLDINLTSGFMYFESVGTENNTVELNSLTNALIFNTNGSIIGSSNIADNDGNINITLPSGNASYVLSYIQEDFTSTLLDVADSEGSNTKTWDITYSLDTNVTNASFKGNVECSRVSALTYTPEDGDATTLTYTCTSGEITAILPEVNDGVNRLSMTLEYSDATTGPICRNLTRSFGTAGAFLVIISLALIAVFVIGKIQGDGNLNLLIAGLVSLGLTGITIIVSIILISGVC